MTAVRLRMAGGIEVRGVGLDEQTRCVHWHSALDIIAIKMRCCGTYYACKDCHMELADHAIEVWPLNEWDQSAVMCGICKRELTVAEYMDCGNICPGCGSGFNPGCRNHYHFYFAAQPSDER